MQIKGKKKSWKLILLIHVGKSYRIFFLKNGRLLGLRWQAKRYCRDGGGNKNLNPKRLKSERGAAKYIKINGLCFENKLQKETYYCFPLLGISKQQQEDIAVSPQYWARAAASKVVEQQASSKISNFPFWFSQNQKTNSILRKGFEIENSLAVMAPLNGHNKGPYKRSFWFQHLWHSRMRGNVS